MPFNGPTILFGAVVEYHPISAKDLSRLHQFGAKVLPGIFLGYAVHAEGIWKGYFMVAKWRRWTHQNSTPEASMQKKCQRRKEVETSYSQSQMEQSKSSGENSV